MILFLSGGLGSKEIVQPDPTVLRSGNRVPAEYRGPYRPIAASNGTQFCEMFPLFAQKANQVAVVRSFQVSSIDHRMAMEAAMMSQRTSVPVTIGQRMSGPCAAPYVLMNPGRRFDALPTAFAQANAYVPAFDHDRRIFLDPSSPEGVAASRIRARDEFPDEEIDEEEQQDPTQRMDDERMQSRRGLLRSVQRESRLDTPETRRMEQFQETTFEMTRGGGRFLGALRMRPADRERFGNSLAGDMALTGLQFLREGAGAVVVYYEPDFRTFDSHENLRGAMETHAPPIDRVIAELIEESRRLGFTLVITTEFNRTPRMNRMAGRDHHNKGNWAAFCGPRVRAGAVYGSTDYQGEITDRPVPQQPALPNTILHLSGFPHPPGQPVITEISR